MFRYAVYGGHLASELEFPDLSAHPGGDEDRPDWIVRVVDSPAGRPPGDLVALGAHETENVHVDLYRTADGLLLDYDDLGRYEVRAGSREMVWHARPDDSPEMARAAILGPVLALALEESGVLCLHGSAVGIAGEAIAVLAPKYHGKSTLACALVAAGARLMTDDAVAVDLGGAGAAVRPGVHSVRLWSDSAAQLRASELPGRLLTGVKSTLVDMPAELLASESLPLAAVYVLESVRHSSDGEGAVARTPLQPLAAAVALATHTKVPAPLLGAAGGGRQLLRAAALVRTTPVYRLEIVRDFARLPEVVGQLLAWHGAAADVALATANGEASVAPALA